MDMANPEVVAAPPQNHQLQNERRLWPRIGKAGALLAIGAAGALYSATHVETESTIAGHRVETTLTADGFSVIDTGMPGAVALPSDLPAGIGAHLNVKEMPADLSIGSDPAELTATELQRYAQSLSDLEDDLRGTAEAIAKQSLLYGLGSMAVAASLYKLPGKEARQLAYDHRLQPVMQRLTPALMAVSLLGINLPTHSVGTEQASGPGDGFIPVSSVFDGTPLEGAYVKGRWMQLAVNTVGARIIDYIETNDTFYDTAAANMQAALDESLIYRPTETTMTGLFLTDYHCNTGMSEVIETVAKNYGISFALDGGDTTASGSEYEEICVRPLGKALAGIPRAVSPGNHDDPAVTGPQMKRAGFKLLDGQPIQLEGLTILGDSDPRRSQLGIDMYQTGEESVEDVGRRLADVACSAKEPVDILVIHDHDAATETLRRGCARFALSGHTHSQQAEEVMSFDGTTRLQIVGGSAGGAGGDMPTFGPLYDDASMVILSIDKRTHELRGYQTLTVHPDASVTVGPRQHRLSGILMSQSHP